MKKKIHNSKIVKNCLKKCQKIKKKQNFAANSNSKILKLAVRLEKPIVGKTKFQNVVFSFQLQKNIKKSLKKLLLRPYSSRWKEKKILRAWKIAFCEKDQKTKFLNTLKRIIFVSQICIKNRRKKITIKKKIAKKWIKKM